jgi:hypothetical protein
LYVCVRLGVSLQAPPIAVHRRHRYEYAIGAEPVHVPGEA